MKIFRKVMSKRFLIVICVIMFKIHMYKQFFNVLIYNRHESNILTSHFVSIKEKHGKKEQKSLRCSPPPSLRLQQFNLVNKQSKLSYTKGEDKNLFFVFWHIPVLIVYLSCHVVCRTGGSDMCLLGLLLLLLLLIVLRLLGLLLVGQPHRLSLLPRKGFTLLEKSSFFLKFVQFLLWTGGEKKKHTSRECCAREKWQRAFLKRKCFLQLYYGEN